MFLDESTQAAIYWSQIWSRFQPLTPMGREAKRELLPFMPGQETAWENTLHEQELLWQSEEKDPDWGRRIETYLRKVPDIENVLFSLERDEQLGVSDWFILKQFVWQVRLWRKSLEEQDLEDWTTIKEEVWESLLTLLNPTPPLTPSFYLADAYDQRLSALRKRLQSLEKQIREHREEAAKRIEAEFGVRRNRAGEWVVERDREVVKHLEADQRLGRVRETPFDVVFVLLPTKVEEAWVSEREQVLDEIKQVEKEVCRRLAREVRPFLSQLVSAVEELTHFDLQWARMRAAQEWRGCRPHLAADKVQIRGGFHPVIAEQLEEKGQLFTPLDMELPQGTTVIIGPNMGGKTVALRTLGIICALAQYGFFVPAKACSLPLYPYIAGVIGDGQDTQAGLSTFGAEVARLSKFLTQEQVGLLLLDEIGRGTNPVEGAALSAAVTAYLAEKKWWAVHVTHYHEVLQIPGIYKLRTLGLKEEELAEHLAGGSSLAEGLKLLMDYRLVPVTGQEPIPQQALTIAHALGLPETIVTDARQRIASDG